MAIKVTHIKPEFVDQSGGIARIVDQNTFPIRAVLRIFSVAGTTRANHVHKKDYHYIYIESGKCEYSEKDSNNRSVKAETVILESGDVVLSRPGKIHGIKFLEDTVFYAFTTERRDQDKYEKNTERIKII